MNEVFERPDEKDTSVSLVVAYDPCFNNLNPIIRNYLTFFYAEEKFKRVLNLAPFVSFRFGCSLRHDLVGAKVYLLIREKNILLW